MLTVVDDARLLAGSEHAAWSERFNEMFALVAREFENAASRKPGVRAGAAVAWGTAGDAQAQTQGGGGLPGQRAVLRRPILQSRGGGGTSHSQLFWWWVWPLSPARPLEFICQWPVYGIGITRVGIDGQVILDAARRGVQLWPEDDPDAAA
jgi:hypothetical protein